ncbi:hypothetical protein WT41_01550 [Burkholderia territorii]|uniref:hypothetical protein n=1 Tax=Burkholderia territorii TaxID=1503055 RepID=UPI000759A48F|nr:hypothetical protein [Burkholderia territorii]KWA35761.1 hypothetical protein WT41_01550 [Burkholderia territorii]
MNDQQQSRADALTDRIKAMFVPNPADELGPTDEPESKYRFGYNTALEDVLGVLATSANETGAEGAVRAYGVFRTRPDENGGQEFFYHANWHNEYLPQEGERIVEGWFVPAMAAAAPRFEVSAGGEWFAATEAQYNAWSGKKRIAATAPASADKPLWDRRANVIHAAVDRLGASRAAATPAASVPAASPGVWPTDAMNQAGLRALAEFHHTRGDTVDAVFLAMCAAAPQPAQADAQAEAREPVGWHYRVRVNGQWTEWKSCGKSTVERYQHASDMQFMPVYRDANYRAPADAGEARLTDDLRTEFEWCLAEGNIGPRTRAAIQRLLNGADHD